MSNIIDLKEGLKNKYVAFLDILGFSELVFGNNTTTLETYFNNLTSIVEYYKKEFSNLEILIISDSVILITNDDQNDFINLLICIQDIQSKLLFKGIILRGGVSFGEVFYQKDILVGKGFIRAYKLEQQASLPRVIIDPYILNKIGGTRRKFESVINWIKFPETRVNKLVKETKSGNYLIEDSDAIEISYISKVKYELILDPNRDEKLESLYSFIKDKLFDKQEHFVKYRWIQKQLALLPQYDNSGISNLINNSQSNQDFVNKYLHLFGEL